MSSTEDPKEGQPSAGEAAPAQPEQPVFDHDSAYADDSYTYQGSAGPVQPEPVTLTPAPVTAAPVENSIAVRPAASVPAGPRKPPPPPPPPPPDDDEDEDDEGMLRMSFMEHLEELRKRILHMLGGVVIIFFLSLIFSSWLWDVISAPAVDALKQLGLKEPNLVAISPMDTFNIIYMKLPLLCAIFLGSPWIVYQVWRFIAPGLYKKERRWAVPFVLCTAGLFLTGGAFAYFVAFRYGLVFLLGLGISGHIVPMISVVEYFDLFVDVMLGIGLVFEMPIIIFFLTLLRLASPRFLIAHSRYAILGIVILAAIVTPTPDVFNLMLFATPMCLLFYVGIFASYLLVLKREGRTFPWRKVLTWAAIVGVIVGGLAFAFVKSGLHFIHVWPFFTR
jgi:sec-independent protein translocase protein TatC